jgi:hypothetical protein
MAGATKEVEAAGSHETVQQPLRRHNPTKGPHARDPKEPGASSSTWPFPPGVRQKNRPPHSATHRATKKVYASGRQKPTRNQKRGPAEATRSQKRKQEPERGLETLRGKSPPREPGGPPGHKLESSLCHQQQGKREFHWREQKCRKPHCAHGQMLSHPQQGPKRLRHQT